MPYHRHLNSAADLITPYEAIRAGFVAQALEKNRRGTPFIQQARDLKTAAERAANPHALLEMPDIQASLLTAAAVSDKALNYLRPEDRRAAIVNLIENFLLPAGDNFVEELVYRFLLTRGDTLGGSMRNYGGAIAQQRLSAALIARMRNQGTPFHWRQAGATALGYILLRMTRPLPYSCAAFVGSMAIDPVCLFTILPFPLFAKT